MESSSFKQYLQSKQVLVEALKNTPHTTTQYVMRKYCKLPTTDETTPEISLKPKHIIIVECSWPSYQTPTIHAITFLNVENVDSTKKFILPWKNDKILSWLDKNTTMESWLNHIKV